ncbi:hypothetical protein HOY82DRAFT_46931 [Tuber indicum]|nr:hypothetical protein HOY82DRAFT_46931 [Tuber indicum]
MSSSGCDHRTSGWVPRGNPSSLPYIPLKSKTRHRQLKQTRGVYELDNYNNNIFIPPLFLSIVFTHFSFFFFFLYYVVHCTVRNVQPDESSGKRHQTKVNKRKILYWYGIVFFAPGLSLAVSFSTG